MKQMNAEVGEEFPIEVDILHALEDFLDAYDDHAEMVVTEAIANRGVAAGMVPHI